MPRKARYPRTPDGRYFVVRGRLWRLSDPSLTEARRVALVRDLMVARRAVGVARRNGDQAAEASARAAVNAAKNALGERGPPWWADGAPDLNRHMVRTTAYADWFARLADEPERFPGVIGAGKKERNMSDDKTQRGPQDASRINMNEDYEVQYWTKRFGVSKERLQSAVDRAGVGADAVAKELGKSNS